MVLPPEAAFVAVDRLLPSPVPGAHDIFVHTSGENAAPIVSTLTTKTRPGQLDAEQGRSRTMSR